MKLRVAKCCFCFDLKFGFFTFGIISLIFRVVAIASLWGSLALAANIITSNIHGNEAAVYIGAGYSLSTPAIGYTFATTIALVIALRGIMLEKSILIYPYLVVLVIEIIVTILFHLWATAVLTPLFLISLIITTALTIYIFICLWSVYKEIIQRECSAKPLLPLSFTNEQAGNFPN